MRDKSHPRPASADAVHSLGAVDKCNQTLYMNNQHAQVAQRHSHDAHRTTTASISSHSTHVFPHISVSVRRWRSASDDAIALNARLRQHTDDTALASRIASRRCFTNVSIVAAAAADEGDLEHQDVVQCYANRLQLTPRRINTVAILRYYDCRYTSVCNDGP